MEAPRFNEASFDYYPALRRVRDFVEAHYSTPITLDRVAKIAELERCYFSHYFHQKTGIRFQDWLTYVRIRLATELLRAEDNRICAVAERVGYKDLRTFERAFRRVTGVTPSEYKKDARPD